MARYNFKKGKKKDDGDEKGKKLQPWLGPKTKKKFAAEAAKRGYGK